MDKKRREKDFSTCERRKKKRKARAAAQQLGKGKKRVQGRGGEKGKEGGVEQPPSGAKNGLGGKETLYLIREWEEGGGKGGAPSEYAFVSGKKFRNALLLFG